MFLLVTTFMFPLAGAGALLLGQQTAKIAVTERELGGVGYTQRIIEVARALRALRDRMAIDHDPGLRERRAVDAALGALYDYDSGGGRSLELTKRLARLADEWSMVPPGPRGEDAVEATLATALSLFGVTNDRSALAADTDPVTEQLIDAYGSQLATVAAQTDRAKVLLVRGGAAQNYDDRVEAAVLLGKARGAFDIAHNDVENAVKDGGAGTDRLDPLLVRTADGIDLFVALTTQTRGPGTGRDVVTRADDVLENVYALDGALADRLEAVLAERAHSERDWLALLRIEAICAGIIATCCAVLLARTLRDRDRRELARARADADRLGAELERQHQLEALAVTEAQLRAVFDRSAIGVAIIDRDGKLVRSNGALAEMVSPIDPNRIGAGHPDFGRLLAGEIESFVTELGTSTSAGHLSWLEATVSLVRDDRGAPRYAISMVKDVSERKRIDDQLRHEATHDALTGLPNRMYFAERLRTTFFAGETPPAGEHAVLFVDLDEFKFVNDSLGHGTGDLVLRSLGQRLRAATSGVDSVARFGGDEFAVLLTGRESREELEREATRLGKVLAEPITIEGREIFVSASIGVAHLDAIYATAGEVMRDADTAMYHAKSMGRARSAVFDAAMHDRATRRLEIANHLPRALEREELHLVYQPVVSLVTGLVESFEVLLRWDSPELGLVPPAEFIPIAEEIGLIPSIGRYALEHGCAQFARWRIANPRRVEQISINVSARELAQPDYVTQVVETMHRNGLAPGELVLELTESTVVANERISAYTLERLRDAGVGLAIDDFGTGYSSLRYLQLFPFDQLKIDRTFVSGSDGSLASEPIVAMLVTLAQACNVKLVAEGVETDEQAERLRLLGCASAQGFLYGPPMEAGDMPDIFVRRIERTP